MVLPDPAWLSLYPKAVGAWEEKTKRWERKWRGKCHTAGQEWRQELKKPVLPTSSPVPVPLYHPLVHHQWPFSNAPSYLPFSSFNTAMKHSDLYPSKISVIFLERCSLKVNQKRVTDPTGFSRADKEHQSLFLGCFWFFSFSIPICPYFTKTLLHYGWWCQIRIIIIYEFLAKYTPWEGFLCFIIL